MLLNKLTAIKTVEHLLQINAIKLKLKNSFTWASGWRSPIYCDNRISLSYPKVRHFVCTHFAEQIEQLYGKPEVIAGVATGAIGIGVLVANYMNLPFVYVRPEPKKHGRQNQIEGFLQPNAKVVVIEDLISTGKSSLGAVDALQIAGAEVLGMLAIFSYGFDIASENFKKANVELHTLSNYDTLLEQSLENQYINADQLHVLQQWRKSPSTWSS